MGDKSNNQASLAGEVLEPLTFRNEMYGEKFYTSFVGVKRLSGYVDRIPIIISERLIDTATDHVGRLLWAAGQLRSYGPQAANQRMRLFVRQFGYLTETDMGSKANQVFLAGHILDTPTHRETPNGREISDFRLIVERAYGKTDCIPCICWSRDARFASQLQPNTEVELFGRIQSRDYLKELPDGIKETRTTYEVSVSTIAVVS